jgi:long-chain acyl-CoA synthetase
MPNKQPWFDSYPETARRFNESSIGHDHLAEVVTVAARNYRNRPAVSTQLPNGACATLTFGDVDRLTDDFAAYLRGMLGLEAGTPVALMSPNCIGFVVATFGIFKAGCICTNINPLYTAPEMEHQLNDSGARVLVIIDLFGDKADAVVPNTDVQQVVTISLADYFPQPRKALMQFVMKRIKKMVPAMRSPHLTLPGAARKGAEHRKTHGTDVSSYRSGQSSSQAALYQYTGGTTGRSKGAELTHGNILANATSTVSLVEETMDRDDPGCSLVALPLYHITAFALIMIPSLVYGAHAIMIPSPRPPSNLKAAFENHRITHFSGINTLFAALLEEPWCKGEALKYLKLCSSGGAAQLVAVAERWEELTGLPIHQGYGLTECAGCMTLNPFGANRTGFAGVPVPLMEVRVADDEGNEVPIGERGEVIARGPSIMRSYLNRPEATRETLKDGWLHTGDIGVMDESGYLQIVDRKKDMILVSGFNVYPNEVEDVIAELDGVVEVGVVGEPDERTGESIKAFVVSSEPALDQDRVLEHCRTSLTNYKRPRSVVFVDEIPKSPVGKILRRLLREMNGD